VGFARLPCFISLLFTSSFFPDDWGQKVLIAMYACHGPELGVAAACEAKSLIYSDLISARAFAIIP
jgi:hypothetical protein